MPSATIDLSKVLYAKVPSKKPESSSLLASVKRIEKQTFPPSEAFDFDSELCKRTTNLYCAYLHCPISSTPYQLYGYIVFLRTRMLTRIHKVCVVESLRGQGLGGFMIGKVIEELKRGKASEVDLWVDTQRAPARSLYRKYGFEEQETVEEYYGKSRAGVRMSLRLQGPT